MNILVIKLGALGDVVLAFQPFADIRAHHPAAHITLLTTRAFAPLLEPSPWFDAIAIDTRPPLWNLPALLRLRRKLQGYDRVYDLQTSRRSSLYFHLAGRPPWSGIARGASHPHDNPARNAMHTIDRQRDQLARAGVPPAPPADLSWLTRDPPPVPHPYALLVPGAAPHRPAKRWPPDRFGQLAALLQDRGLTPVIAGSAAEAPLAATIVDHAPAAIDLTGQTTLPQLASLAAHAAMAIGNDTGPMHLAAATGTPCLVLFSAASDPALTAPRNHTTILREPNLADLTPERVAASLPSAHTVRPETAGPRPDARHNPP